LDTMMNTTSSLGAAVITATLLSVLWLTAYSTLHQMLQSCPFKAPLIPELTLLRLYQSAPR
jgi:hypothetical protein